MNANVFAGVSIVTPQDVALDWRNLQIVDARSPQEVNAGRIPGAIHLDWREFRVAELSTSEKIFGLRDGRVLSEASEIAARLTKLGLREDLPILVYGGESRWGEEGRVAWNLLYWGAKDVRLLDGGFAQWKKSALKVAVKKIPKKNFVVRLDPSRRIEFAALEQFQQSKTNLFDVRTIQEFQRGHISHARLVSDDSLYRADGRYPTREELRAKLSELSPTVVTYCAGGVRSALLALLIEARLGVKAQNYDGSMWDWDKRRTR
jgi:thiosulfate/3-mercaptopyruvate sulfurtransferase